MFPDNDIAKRPSTSIPQKRLEMHVLGKKRELLIELDVTVRAVMTEN